MCPEKKIGGRISLRAFRGFCQTQFWGEVSKNRSKVGLEAGFPVEEGEEEDLASDLLFDLFHEFPQNLLLSCFWAKLFSGTSGFVAQEGRRNTRMYLRSASVTAQMCQTAEIDYQNSCKAMALFLLP